MNNAKQIYDVIVELLYAPMIAVHVGTWVLTHFTKHLVILVGLRFVVLQLGGPVAGPGWRRIRKTLTFAYSGLIAGCLAYWIWPQHPQYSKLMMAVINALLAPAITLIAFEVLKRFEATKGIADYLGANDPYSDGQS